MFSNFNRFHDISYSNHAEQRMVERHISQAEIEEILRKSSTGIPGKSKGTFEAISVTAHARRIKVVYTKTPTGPHVVTAHIITVI